MQDVNKEMNKCLPASRSPLPPFLHQHVCFLFLFFIVLCADFCRSDINEAKTASTATFVTALVFNAAVFAAELGVFTLIRPYFKSIYEPRTYVPPPGYGSFHSV